MEQFFSLAYFMFLESNQCNCSEFAPCCSECLIWEDAVRHKLQTDHVICNNIFSYASSQWCLSYHLHQKEQFVHLQFEKRYILHTYIFFHTSDLIKYFYLLHWAALMLFPCYRFSWHSCWYMLTGVEKYKDGVVFCSLLFIPVSQKCVSWHL